MSRCWVAAWLRASASAVHDAAPELTALDAAIGDGDHGINLDRGFRLLVARLDDPGIAGLPSDMLLSEAGRLLLGSVGGASGALYGRALMRAGTALGRAARDAAAGPAGGDGCPDLELERVSAALDAAVAAIAALGRSAPGDKTMLDALDPAAAALRTAAASDDDLRTALDRSAVAAEAGAESTRPLVARRGRASYLGDRSAGHLDPGAVSSALLVRALASTLPRHAHGRS